MTLFQSSWNILMSIDINQLHHESLLQTPLMSLSEQLLPDFKFSED